MSARYLHCLGKSWEHRYLHNVEIVAGDSGQWTYWDRDQNSFGGSNYVHNGPGSPVVVPVVFQHLYCLSGANEAPGME